MGDFFYMSMIYKRVEMYDIIYFLISKTCYHHGNSVPITPILSFFIVFFDSMTLNTYDYFVIDFIIAYFQIKWTCLDILYIFKISTSLFFFNIHVTFGNISLFLVND